MLAVFDEMQNDDIVAIASADTDYLTLIEFLKAKGPFLGLRNTSLLFLRS